LPIYTNGFTGADTMEMSREASLIYLSKKYVELLRERHRDVQNYLKNIKKNEAVSPNLFNISTFEEALEWLKGSIEYKIGILRDVEAGVGSKNMEAILGYLEFYDHLLKRIAYFLHQFSLGSSNTFLELNAFMYDFLDRFEIKNALFFTVGSEFSVYFPGKEVAGFSNVLDANLIQKLMKLPYFVSVPLIDIDNWKKLPALIHEAAHIVDEHLKISSDIFNSMAHRQLDESSVRLAYEWTSEIVPDIISARYLGPPYLCLFLNSPDYLVHDSIQATHPPIRDRIRLILQELETIGFSDETLRQQVNTVSQSLSPISVDAGFANTIVKAVKSKTSNVVISKDHLNEVYTNVEKELVKGRTVLEDANILLNVVYDRLGEEDVKTSFKKSMLAQYLNKLSNLPSNETIKDLGMKDLPLKIQLLQLWRNGVKRRQTTPNERGIALENYFRVFLNSIKGVKVTETRKRTRTAEIDLIAEIEKGALRSYSPYCLVECKNLEGPMSASAVRSFVAVVDSYSEKIKLAIIVSTSGFSRDSRDEMLRHTSKPYSFLMLSGQELEGFHTSNESIEKFVRRKIRENVFV
jgi:hypothetical protein